MRNQVMADYLRDPRAKLFEKMIEEGTSTAPVQHWSQGVGNLSKALVGAYMANKLKGEYDSKISDASNERELASKFALGQPAETQKYGETTINWNEQAPDLSKASGVLKSPYNSDFQEQLLNAQLQQNQTKAQQEFLRQQQEQQFAQQRQLADMTLQRQIGFEKWKQQNDPQRQIIENLLRARQAQNQSLPPQIPQGQSPTLGDAGITINQMPPQEIPLVDRSSLQPNNAQPKMDMNGTQQIDPLNTYALTGKFPKDFGLDAQGNPVMPREQTEFSKELAKKDAQSVAKERESILPLITFEDTLNSATSRLENVPSLKLGPIGGRISSLVGDPATKDLASDLNSLALQSRTLLALPASGFSDADREFLVDVVSGTATQKFGIEQILTKLKTMNQKAITRKKDLIGYAEKHGGLTGYTPSLQPDKSGWSIQRVE